MRSCIFIKGCVRHSADGHAFVETRLFGSIFLSLDVLSDVKCYNLQGCMVFSIDLIQAENFMAICKLGLN